jgi:hypothetical protein
MRWSSAGDQGMRSVIAERYIQAAYTWSSSRTPHKRLVLVGLTELSLPVWVAPELASGRCFEASMLPGFVWLGGYSRLLLR